MKLYYFKFSGAWAGVRNFGDDLNEWLWKKLLPDVFDDAPGVLFIGIGTILSAGLPAARRTVVFGSGVRAGHAPTVDASWDIYCVRGPLSARALHLDADKAVTDGAFLIRLLRSPQTARNIACAYMPHVGQAYLHGSFWRAVCDDLGYAYIDPQDGVEEVLEAIGRSELLITEAMHGAIVADALRVPWIPVTSSRGIDSFKWRDWCSSLDMPYEPHRILVARRLAEFTGFATLAKGRLLRKCVATQLARAAKSKRIQLSDETTANRRIEQLQGRIEAFGSDVAAGRFAVE